MAPSQQPPPLVAPGRLRIAAWASCGLYLVAVATWASSSWRAARGSSSAFAADLTGLSVSAALLIVLAVFRRLHPRRSALLAELVLGAVALFWAAQVGLDLARRTS